MNRTSIKVKETPEGNLYRLIPPFPNSNMSTKKEMVEYLLLRTVITRDPPKEGPKSQICISDKDMTKITPMITFTSVSNDAALLAFLDYDLLDVKPETGKVFGDMLTEL
jgi:hypothetical protein